jgi:hypothetical protein
VGASLGSLEEDWVPEGTVAVEAMVRGTFVVARTVWPIAIFVRDRCPVSVVDQQFVAEGVGWSLVDFEAATFEEPEEELFRVMIFHSLPAMVWGFVAEVELLVEALFENLYQVWVLVCFDQDFGQLAEIQAAKESELALALLLLERIQSSPAELRTKASAFLFLEVGVVIEKTRVEESSMVSSLRTKMMSGFLVSIFQESWTLTISPEEPRRPHA